MNKLLSFQPEPFDSEFQSEALLQDLGMQGESYEQEGESEFGGARGRSRYGRSGAAFSSASRAPRQLPMRPRTKPGGLEPTPPRPWPQGRPYRQPGYGVGVPVWPYGVEPVVAAVRAEPDMRRWTPDDPATGLPLGQESAVASEHVRWVQDCLNRSLGLRLPIDGVMNAQTRSAVRAFQERRGLAINGLVGRETETALRAACDAGASTPGKDGEFESEADVFYKPQRQARPAGPSPSVSPPIRAAAPTANALRENILRIAKEELARWHNGTIKETDPRLIRVLQDYWESGPGVRFSEAQLGSKEFQNDHPWSAAFISWVMRNAGAGNAFKYASSHSVYTHAAKQNRLANNSNPFKAFRVSEAAPRVGDLVCKRRAGSGATYDNIRPGMKTHCDVVAEAGPNGLTLIGGNVDNSVSSGKHGPLKTDSKGLIADPRYFAVIRVGADHAPIPDVPPPAPLVPGVVTPPNLLRKENAPPGTSLYVGIDLNIVDKFKIGAAPMTGIFIPDGFVPGPAVDILLYLHGHKSESNRLLSIDQYWNGKRFAYGAFREAFNSSGRNVILVAPTLGARSEAGALIRHGGLDAYLAKVLAAIHAYGPGQQSTLTPALRNLILACHSGGGLTMRQLAGGADKVLANLRECWGYDCTYNRGDDTFWAGWARKSPGAKCYFYYIRGSQTAPLSESLRNMRVANAIVQPSKDDRHNYVPITHWQERLQGADFLGARSGGRQPPIVPPGPSDEPNELKSLSKEEFIDFVGQNARKATTATGVPASVTVAQAILETGWGKHTIGPARNLFGIKGKGPAGSIRVPTREFVNGRWVTVEANFAKYESFEQSINEHARFFLRNRRYAAALRVKDDPDAFAREIHKAGYATGPDYASELIKLMKRHNLYRFDR